LKLEEVNKQIKVCRRCRLFETRANALCGEGPRDARIMLVAQAPGENEDREGRMFIGPSGKVLDELLRMAGVCRDEIYITNLIKCMLPRYRKPKQDEIVACSKYLDEEIDVINPSVLAPLGYYASRYIFMKYSLDFPDREEVYTIYGRLFLTSNGKDGGAAKKIYPLRHPAALLYNEGLSEEMERNYHKLGILLHDCAWFKRCPERRRLQEVSMDNEWLELYCKGDWESCPYFAVEGGRER